MILIKENGYFIKQDGNKKEEIKKTKKLDKAC